MRHLALLCAALCVAGCGSSNVFVGDIAALHPDPSGTGPASAESMCAEADPRVIRLYYDRDGDLYPASAQAGHVLSDHFAVADTVRLRDNFLRLDRSGQHEASDPWPATLARFGLEDAGRGADQWNALQDSVHAEAMRGITAALSRAGEGATLVVLVHGFNNQGCAADNAYRALRDSVESRLDASRAVYVQLYWDGLSNLIGIPVWGNAQFNFPLVGLSFRRVMNELPHDVPVRIITHSSGGPLVANTLWEASAPVQNNRHVRTYPRYGDYFARASGGPDVPQAFRLPTHPDIRVGMLVPAMPQSTFYRKTENGQVFAADRSSPAMVIVGINRTDSVIGKMGLGCGFGGATCLAKRRTEVCRLHRDAQQLSGETPLLRMVDFSDTSPLPTAFRPNNHGVSLYARNPAFERFLSLLFAPGEPVGDENTLCR